MKTICLCGVVFTLQGKAPEENKYLPIFLLWLTQLLKTGGLTPADRLILFIDSVSAEYLREKTPFETLFEAVPCQEKQVILVHQPLTLIEGTRYRFHTFSYTQDIFLYLDIDVFVTRSLHDVFDYLPSDAIFGCQHEGNLTSPDYSEGQELHISDPLTPGYSSGKFFFTNEELHKEFCSEVLSTIDVSTRYYTIEQPFFNKVVYTKKIPVFSDPFMKPLVANTGTEFQKGWTWLLDFAGFPGNAEKHWEHMWDAYLLLHAGLL